MKQIISGGQDISQLVEKITWSGDTKQVARKLVFSAAAKHTDPYLPKLTLKEGGEVRFLDNGKTLFGGILFDIDRSVTSNTVTYTAFDLLFYINNSEISEVFNATPEAVTAQICKKLDVPFGSAAKTGIKVYMPCLGKKAYDAIMMAYTAASRKNGKKYLPVMQNINQVCVIEKGDSCGVIVDGSYNLMEASYKTSLQKAVNRVLVANKDGKVLRTLKDEQSPLPGVIQRVYKEQDGKDTVTEAKALLQGLEQSGSLTVLSDTRAVSGTSICVQEPVTGLYGKFFIEADTHTFSGAKEEMQLTLAFENLMDEKEIEKDQTKK